MEKTKGSETAYPTAVVRLDVLAVGLAFLCSAGQKRLPRGFCHRRAGQLLAKDIFGMKICWDKGRWGYYAASGEFSKFERDLIKVRQATLPPLSLLDRGGDRSRAVRHMV
jgi:hypothetical protein